VPPPPAPAPSATPTADRLIATFIGTLTTAIHDGHRTDFADLLDPVVIARYGIDQCRALLGSRDPDPAYSITIAAPASPAPWDYVTDGLTTTIPDAIAIDAVVSDLPPGGGSPTATSRTLHVHVVDGAVRWFTDCGTPTGASPSP